MNKKLLIPLSVLITIGALIFIVQTIRSSMASPADKVHYPYVCKDCKAVFDVSELKKPGMWRIAKGAPTDSVVVCVKCNKGTAYPVGLCEECGTEHILYIVRDSRCPKCSPEAAAAAKKAGIDTVFKRPG